MASKNVSSKWVSGNLVFYDKNGNAIFTIDGTNRALAVATGAALQGIGAAGAQGSVLSIRARFTIAQINTGAALLAAVTGLKYRMVGCKAIAYGGAVGATTTVDILGTQASSSVKLAAFAQASLTQSAVLTAGGSGGTVLADGASFAPCDAATGITIGKTGASLTTATGVDIVFDFVLEA